MNYKNRKILENIFADPVIPAISWADIVGVFRGYGGIIKEGRGSRVWFIWKKQVAVLHRPNLQPNTNKGAVKSVRCFFANRGVKP